MNKFQKDLTFIRDRMKSNKDEFDFIKNLKDKTEIEATKLNMDFFELEKEISHYLQIKRKIRKYEKKVAKTRRNTILTLFAAVLSEFLCLTFLSNPSISIILYALFSGTVLVLGSNQNNIYLNKITKISNGLSKEEINNIINDLVLQKGCKKYALNYTEDKMFEYEKLLNNLKEKESKIYYEYKVILDSYQNALLEIDVAVSDKQLTEKLDEKYNEEFPTLAKKIINKKND